MSFKYHPGRNKLGMGDVEACKGAVEAKEKKQITIVNAAIP